MDGAAVAAPGEILEGLGVSPGIAIGRALVLAVPDVRTGRVDLAPGREGEEAGRFRRAVAAAGADLRELGERVRRAAGEASARIFEAQGLILNDPALLEETAALIGSERVNAEWALRVVMGRHRRALMAGDPRRRGHAADLWDVEVRLRAVLSGGGPSPGLADLEEDVIVVSATLSPSEAVALHRPRVIGLALDAGGPTSHTAILAAALGLPAVTGLRDASRRIRSGERLILDGDGGRLVRGAGEAELQAWRRRREERAARAAALQALRDEPAVTRDGARVALRANLELPGEIEAARRAGAEGIGLFRSEFVYLEAAPDAPDEEAQVRLYRSLLEQARPHEVVIRTVDLAEEAGVMGLHGGRSGQAVLGLRGIRLSLQRPDLFRPQLRAILRAAAHGRARVLFPMVAGLEELRRARAALESAARELWEAGVPHATVPVGVMIEVPAAAILADALAREADFLSIGTNDLIQYTLAADRREEAVSYLYQPLHPAILRLVRGVAEAAGRAGKPASVCGEMAGHPLSAAVLIGLGIMELSMAPAAIPPVKEAIRRLDLHEARAAAGEALEGRTTAEVMERLRRRFPDLAAAADPEARGGPGRGPDSPEPALT